MTQTNIHTRDGADVTEDDQSERSDGETVNVCPECGGHVQANQARAETVCQECGLVIKEDSVDKGPEWRAFSQDEKDEKSRVGAPTTNMMHDKGLSTNIGWKNKDARGNKLSSRQRKKMQRLRTWDERFRAIDSSERNLKQALGEIDRMASALGLPESIRETASVIYRRALDEHLLPGRSIEGVATASLYAAARMANNPRSISEFVTVSRVERKEISRTYLYINRELDLAVAPASPTNFIPRYVSELTLSQEVERIGVNLVHDAADKGVTSGKGPTGLAGAAVYAGALLAGEEVTQREVSEVAGVSKVTIRNRYQELLDIQDDDLT